MDKNLEITYKTTDTAAVAAFVRSLPLPKGTKAEIVGKWVWITFPAKPEKDIRQALCNAGFRWIDRRGAWAHACGNYSRHSKADPRDKYQCETVTLGAA